MEMKTEEAIEKLSTGLVIIGPKDWVEARDSLFDIARKYQKIEQIVSKWATDFTAVSAMIAIKKVIEEALEQEPILDKVRAEIWDLQYGDEEKSMTDEDRADAYNNAIKQVIEIIDKYKADSEE